MMKKIFIVCLLLLSAHLLAKDIFVSPQGDDGAAGTSKTPLKTISAAAQMAQSGDVVTVMSGVYREMIQPVNGGRNSLERIVYKSAEGATVVIKGSEQITKWKRVHGTVYKVTLPNAFFGDYNPYKDLIHGDWFDDRGRDHHTGQVYINEKAMFEVDSLPLVMTPEPYALAEDKAATLFPWYCECDEHSTTIWANFQDFDPSKELIEINVRRSCFYPATPETNYITVRGFKMTQAATQWAAPTAEQIALIGTHWSKGWIIENNEISNSRCVGIALGKDRSTGHNLWYHNQDKDGSALYHEVIFKALDRGWSKQRIGSHLVRNNVIHDCGQAGVVGSLGAIFSTISDNYIYNIWTHRSFRGAEIGGIKIHGAIDVLIARNHIHNASRGIWLDWMGQGTRVTKNLLYKNDTDDFFAEVNHGPYIVDNNICLSPVSVRDWSQGGAFVNNLFAGKIVFRQIMTRATPYHFPHSTRVLGVTQIPGGDDRYYNNLLLGGEDVVAKDMIMNDYPRIGFKSYELAKYDNFYRGNALYRNSVDSVSTNGFAMDSPFDPHLKILENQGEIRLKFEMNDEFQTLNTPIVTTPLLGRTFISEAVFENFDASELQLDDDFLGKKRSATKGALGPFSEMSVGQNEFVVWSPQCK